jgi:benzoate transport
MMALDELKALDERPMNRFQVGAIAICVFLMMIDGFDVLAIAFTAPLLAKEWDLAPPAIGALISWGLAGMTAGSLFIAPLADRLGRRWMILLSLVVVSLGMLLAAFCTSPQQLMGIRFFTGLGIGSMLASINTIVAEYSSGKHRPLALGINAAGYPIGATLGGVAAAVIIAQTGWRGVFVMGSLVSLAAIPLVLWGLPESLAFLLTRGDDRQLPRINALLAKLGRPPCSAVPPVDARSQHVGAKEIVAGSLLAPSLLLWSAFFFVMMAFYFVMNWTPKLLVDAGLSPSEGVSGAVLLNVGGIAGTVLLGAMASRFGIYRLLLAYMLIAAVVMPFFGSLAGASLAVLVPMALLLGYFLFALMGGLYTIIPSVYPPQVRNTGTGFAIGMGRFGAVVGPALAGYLLGNQWTTSQIHLAFAIVLVIAAGLIAMLGKAQSSRERARAPAPVPATTP